MNWQSQGYLVYHTSDQSLELENMCSSLENGIHGGKVVSFFIWNY